MRIVLFILTLVLVFRCKEKTAEPFIKRDASKDTTSFFQLSEYIQSQVNEVNKTPFFIYRIDITNGKKDSSSINNAIFNQLSKPFLETGINDPAMRKSYTENVFHDQTTKSYTLSYTTANKELPVQSIDVLLNEDAQTVKRIFMRKFFNNGDSSVIEQLSWKPNERFQINRLVQKANNQETVTELTIVWNDKDNDKK